MGMTVFLWIYYAVKCYTLTELAVSKCIRMYCLSRKQTIKYNLYLSFRHFSFPSPLQTKVDQILKLLFISNIHFKNSEILIIVFYPGLMSWRVLSSDAYWITLSKIPYLLHIINVHFSNFSDSSIKTSKPNLWKK